MTRAEVVRKIEAKVAELGLKSGYSKEWGGWVAADSENSYIFISVLDMIDFDRSKEIEAGHFVVSATVRKMGGCPYIDELYAAADQIRLAADFVKACSEMDLTYRQYKNGEPA